MTWQTEITESVRVLIGDMDETQVYSDNRIERTIVIGASQVIQEVDFSTIYTVDISLQNISPDPTTISPKDSNFINLISLKSAILIYTGELRKYALTSAIVTDGPSTINMGSVYSNMKASLANLQFQYEKAKMLYQSGQIGQAVTTPSKY